MQLSDASVSIRPRSPWEALDLGTLLARRQAELLMTTWAAVTLPLCRPELRLCTPCTVMFSGGSLVGKSSVRVSVATLSSMPDTRLLLM